jgi:hypothetical protein
MKYLCYAPEECPDTKKAHWQGFVVWAKGHDCCISACAKRLGKIHVEPTVGSVDENIIYCKGPYVKGAKSKPLNPDFVEFGAKPAQGARVDLDSLKDSIMKGQSVREIAVENPSAFHQYGRTLQYLEDCHVEKVRRTEMTKGIWIHGPTGTGKTEYVETTYPDYYPFEQNDNGWQDKYKGQEVVLIDDFRGGIKFAELLRMVDRYNTYAMPRRNKTPYPFVSKIVFITSSLPPEEVYNNLAEGDKLAQLLRRFEVWERKPFDYVERAVEVAQRTLDDFLIDELD